MTHKDLTSKDTTTSHHVKIETISYTPHNHFSYALDLRNQSKPTILLRWIHNETRIETGTSLIGILGSWMIKINIELLETRLERVPP
jgi:hypothetical protein